MLVNRNKKNEIRNTEKMDNLNKKLETFHDLKVWQKGHDLVINIYEITKNFPKEEQFGLTNQIRRASVSITSNITEGFGRRSPKDKTHFYIMASGSLNEVRNQILISKDINYLSKKDWEMLDEKIITVSKMLNSLIRISSKNS
jgi:four helix bundle protein